MKLVQIVHDEVIIGEAIDSTDELTNDQLILIESIDEYLRYPGLFNHKQNVAGLQDVHSVKHIKAVVAYTRRETQLDYALTKAQISEKMQELGRRLQSPNPSEVRVSVYNISRILRDPKNAKLTIAEIMSNDHVTDDHARRHAALLGRVGAAKFLFDGRVEFSDRSVL